MSANEESAAQEQWMHCWLVSYATVARASASELKAANFPPDLVIDVDADTIRVRNAKANVPVASAPLAQATATPASRMGSYFERKYAPKGLPILVVNVPGAPRLTIGCIEPGQKVMPFNAFRFSWRGTVPRENDPAYVASGGGWLTLVEKFGLTSQLSGSQTMRLSDWLPSPTSESGPPPLYSQPKYAKVIRLVLFGWLAIFIAYFLVLIIIACITHQW
jgi:hypothetical protein